MDRLIFDALPAHFIFPDESQCRCQLCLKAGDSCMCGNQWVLGGKLRNGRPDIRLLEPKLGRGCERCGTTTSCGRFHLDHPSIAFKANEDGIPLDSIPSAAKCWCADTLPPGYDLMPLEWPAMPETHDYDGNVVKKTVANFKQVPGSGEAVQAVQAFCHGDGARILVLLGVNGCGKSHLLESIVRSYKGKGIPVRYDKASLLIDRFRAANQSSASENSYALKKAYAEFPVQVIDEVAKRTTDYSAEIITDMFDARMTSDGRLAIASNLLSYGEIETYYGATLASRMFTANTLQVNLVQMTCNDYRLWGE